MAAIITNIENIVAMTFITTGVTIIIIKTNMIISVACIILDSIITLRFSIN